jgi:hypothetical protein
MFNKLMLTAAFALAPALAVGQTLIFDQINPPLVSQVTQSEIAAQSFPVSGGTLYLSLFRGPGNPPVWGHALAFAPVAAGGLTRNLIATRHSPRPGKGRQRASPPRGRHRRRDAPPRASRP